MDATVDVVNLTVMPGNCPIAQLYADCRSAAVSAAPDRQPASGKQEHLCFAKSIFFTVPSGSVKYANY